MGLYSKSVAFAATSGSMVISGVNGLVTAIRIERSAGTPVVTIAETSGTQETLLNALAVAANITKSPTKLMQLTDGTDGTQRMPFSLENASLTVTLTSVTNPSTITVFVKTVE